MKKRLKEMEDEAAALREMQAKVEKEMGAVQGFFFFQFLVEFLCDLNFIIKDVRVLGFGSQDCDIFVEFDAFIKAETSIWFF